MRDRHPRPVYNLWHFLCPGLFVGLGCPDSRRTAEWVKSREGDMTQTIDEPTTPDADDSRPGMDRRTLIKSAAAAGAVAWTAPIVIESLASPAAAAQSGCTAVSYVGSGSFVSGTNTSSLLVSVPAHGNQDLAVIVCDTVNNGAITYTVGSSSIASAGSWTVLATTNPNGKLAMIHALVNSAGGSTNVTVIRSASNSDLGMRVGRLPLRQGLGPDRHPSGVNGCRRHQSPVVRPRQCQFSACELMGPESRFGRRLHRLRYLRRRRELDDAPRWCQRPGKCQLRDRPGRSCGCVGHADDADLGGLGKWIDRHLLGYLDLDPGRALDRVTRSVHRSAPDAPVT